MTSKAQTVEPLETWLCRMAKKYKNRKFRPSGFYNKTGDCIEIFLDPAEHIAEYIDPYLTLYRAGKLGRIVGGEFSHVRLLARNGLVRLLLDQSGRLDIAGLLFGILVFVDAPHGEGPVGRANRQKKYFDAHFAFRGKMILVEGLVQHPEP